MSPGAACRCSIPSDMSSTSLVVERGLEIIEWDLSGLMLTLSTLLPLGRVIMEHAVMEPMMARSRPNSTNSKTVKTDMPSQRPRTPPESDRNFVNWNTSIVLRPISYLVYDDHLHIAANDFSMLIVTIFIDVKIGIIIISYFTQLKCVEYVVLYPSHFYLGYATIIDSL